MTSTLRMDSAYASIIMCCAQHVDAHAEGDSRRVLCMFSIFIYMMYYYIREYDVPLCLFSVYNS